MFIHIWFSTGDTKELQKRRGIFSRCTASCVHVSHRSTRCKEWAIGHCPYMETCCHTVSRGANEKSLLSPISYFCIVLLMFIKPLTESARGRAIKATQTADSSSQQEIFSITLNWFPERLCKKNNGNYIISLTILNRCQGATFESKHKCASWLGT